MRIGALQFSPVLGETDKTIKIIDSLWPEVGHDELIVLPELANSGYNFESRDHACELSESVDSSPFLEYLVSKCRESGCYIVTGFNERCGDKIYNSSILLDRGGVVGRYRKMHLFVDEKDYFEKGDLGVRVFDIGVAKISMLVCFDWMFPEVWRIAGLKGADIVCHPSNLVLRGLAQSATPVHALINRYYVVTANRVGREGDLKFTGLSVIADPKGKVLCKGSEEDEEYLSAEININASRDKWVTPRNHAFEDRRPDEYGLLIES